jgi:hypothetical protein
MKMKVLTINLSYGDRHGSGRQHQTYEVHMLNVGDVFENFGGSRHPLEAGRDFATGEKQKKPTASIVIRHITPMSTTDKEIDIHDAGLWQLICRCINDPKMAASAELSEELVKILRPTGGIPPK